MMLLCSAGHYVPTAFSPQNVIQLKAPFPLNYKSKVNHEQNKLLMNPSGRKTYCDDDGMMKLNVFFRRDEQFNPDSNILGTRKWCILMMNSAHLITGTETLFVILQKNKNETAGPANNRVFTSNNRIRSASSALVEGSSVHNLFST